MGSRMIGVSLEGAAKQPAGQQWPKFTVTTRKSVLNNISGFFLGRCEVWSLF
jgi:hypothetical protein